MRIAPRTLTHQAYGRDEASEQFRCSFGLNAKYAEDFSKSPLRVAGVDREGDVRVVELPGHPFFVATLYLPQLTSRPGTPHPLVRAYLRAAITFRHRGAGVA